MNKSLEKERLALPSALQIIYIYVCLCLCPTSSANNVCFIAEKAVEKKSEEERAIEYYWSLLCKYHHQPAK